MRQSAIATATALALSACAPAEGNRAMSEGSDTTSGPDETADPVPAPTGNPLLVAINRAEPAEMPAAVQDGRLIAKGKCVGIAIGSNEWVLLFPRSSPVSATDRALSYGSHTITLGSQITVTGGERGLEPGEIEIGSDVRVACEGPFMQIGDLTAR